MQKRDYSSEYFQAKDTVLCGQLFRYEPFDKGYIIISGDKACYIYTEGEKTTVISEDGDYFEKYFDVEKDYSKIYLSAKEFGNETLRRAADSGKGIRILVQQKEENLFEFIISQNNHIPRIKSLIKRVSEGLGEKHSFMGNDYYGFPSAKKLFEKDESYYAKLGFGYRARYFPAVAEKLCGGYDLSALDGLSTCELKKELMKLLGVGAKVADCVMLFSYGRTDSFPVDTWLAKVYAEDFGGKSEDRKEITRYFESCFGNNSGYFQQYLFNYKRNNE